MVLFHRFDFFFRDTNYIQPPLPVFPLFHFLTHPFLFYLGFHSLGGFSDFLHDFIMFSLQSVLPYVFCNLVFVSDTILPGFFFFFAFFSWLHNQFSFQFFLLLAYFLCFFSISVLRYDISDLSDLFHIPNACLRIFS